MMRQCSYWGRESVDYSCIAKSHVEAKTITQRFSDPVPKDLKDLPFDDARAQMYAFNLCRSCFAREVERARNATEPTADPLSLDKTGIPKSFWSSQLADYSPGGKYKINHANIDPINVVRDSDPEAWLYLQGPPGSGKTTLLGIAAAEQARKRSGVRWISEMEFFSAIREEARGAKTNTVADLKAASLLVLDDLGVTVGLKDWQQDRLNEVIAWRYEQSLPTWFTSNEEIKGLAARYGKRTADRISEMVRTPLVLDGINWRKL